METFLSSKSKKIISRKVILFLGIFAFMISVFTFGTELKLRVIAKKANVRLSPTTKSEILSNVPLGATLNSNSKEGNWFKVELPPDKNGFVVSGYIHESTVKVVKKPNKLMKSENKRSLSSTEKKQFDYQKKENFAPEKGNFIVSGTASIESTTFDDYDTESIYDISSSFRLFIRKKIFIGGTLVFRGIEDTFLLRIGPCFGYFFSNENSKIHPYVSMQLLLNTLIDSSDHESRLGIVFGGGVLYPISRHFSLLAEAGYQLLKIYEYSMNTFRINIGIAGLFFK